MFFPSLFESDDDFLQPRRRVRRSRVPLFFKLWFALCATFALAVTAAYGYVLYAIASSSPGEIGQAVGAFVRGFGETAGR